MTVPLTQLYTLAAGWSDWAIESGAWVAHRLPESMRRHYAADEHLDARARCTAGVVLRFRTAATQLRLAVRYGLSCRPAGWGSVVVDGVVSGSFGAQEPTGEWSGPIDLGLAPDRPRQIELWLPHTAQMDILELAADAPLLPCEEVRPRWLALGDSITQGADARHPANTGVCRAARDANLNLLNLGVGSAHAEAVLADLLPAGPFDRVSIAYGLNDWVKNIPPASYTDAIANMAAAARNRWPKAPLLILTATPMRDESTPNALGLTVQHYRDAVHSLSLPPNTQIIDGPNLVPDLNALFDICHPTDDGFAAYARHLIPHLRATPLL